MTIAKQFDCKINISDEIEVVQAKNADRIKKHSCYLPNDVQNKWKELLHSDMEEYRISISNSDHSDLKMLNSTKVKLLNDFSLLLDVFIETD